jgi:hypothetical protein
LEASWLNSLGKQRSRFRKPQYVTVTSSESNIFSSIPWWVYILALAVVRAIIQASKH